MLNVKYVIILDMLQTDVEEAGSNTIMQKDHHIQGTLMDITLLAICLVTELLISIEEICDM